MRTLTQTRPRQGGRGGFTLVELMVAMVIFVTVLGGTILLFNGAVSTVRQGYTTMRGFEQARGALTVMERDLTGAFTAREQGRFYQFYGRPNGFTFVGNVDGTLSRVTYAIQSGTENKQFQTAITERYGTLNLRAVDLDRARGNAGFPTAVLLGRYLQFAGQLSPDIPMTSLGVEFLAQSERTDGGAEPLANELVTLEAIITTGSLVRYAEPGVDNIDTLPFAPPDGPRNYWPSFGEQWARFIPRGPATTVPTEIDRIENRLFFTLIAQPLGLILQEPDNPDFNIIGRDFAEAVYDAAKRDYWLAAMANQGVFAPAYLGENVLPVGDSFTSITGQDPVEYVVTEDIVIRVTPIVPPDFAALSDFDAFGINNNFFDYGAIGEDGETRMRRYFNAISNIAGDEGFYARVIASLNPTAGDYFTGAAAAEQVIAGQYQAERLANIGNPLRPRLPEVVQPKFWIVIENPWVGAAEFRQWFNQVINVPSGQTRGRDRSLPVI